MSELNIQSQLDEPYLATSSPGKIAKAISRITQQEKTDALEASFKKKINDTKRELFRLDEEIDEADERLKKYVKFPKLEEIIQQLLLVSGELENEKKKIEQIEEAAEELRQANKIVDRYKDLEEVKEVINLLEGNEKVLRKAREDYDDLEQAREQAKQTEKDAAKNTRWANRLKKDYLKAIKAVKRCPTCFGKISDATLKMIEKEL